jgi:hypothetical protein
MTPSEGDVYGRVIHRITLAILLLGLAGTATFIATRGWRFALGFFLGACMSYLSFWRWQRVVESLGGSIEKRSIASMVVRFAVLAAAAYGIVKYLDVTPVAVFLGLLISAAAVIVAILFELIYGRT